MQVGKMIPQKQLCCSVFLSFPFLTYIFPISRTSLEPVLFSAELPVSDTYFETAAEIVSAEDANSWKQ